MLKHGAEEEFDRYRRLIDSIDGIVWEADPDLRFTFVSRQAERILGYPAERWVTEPGFWAGILHPEDRSRALQFCEEQVRLMRPHTFEYRVIAADGSQVWLRDLVSVESEGHRPVKLRGIMMDVTSLKIAQDQLKNSEERFRTMAEKSQEGVWILDEQDITVYANPKLCEILGYEIDEMVGVSVFSFMDPDAVKKGEDAMRRRRMGVSERIDFMFRRKNGRRAWVSLAANPFIDRDDRYRGAMAMVSDISDRLRRENLLAAQRNVFEQLIDGKTHFQALESLVRTIEDLGDGMIAAVYFLSRDGAHLEKAAAPSVPDGFIRFIEQLQLAPNLGTCSSAVFRKAMVVTEDVETDKLWDGVRDIAREYGVRACWAQPIFSRNGEVTGIFSMYFREPRRPDSFDIQLARDSAAAVSLVAEHVSLRDSLAAANKRLTESEERFRTLADSTFDSVVIHDHGRIVVANISAAQLLGIDREELEGESLLRFIDPEFHGILAERLQGPANYPYEIRCVRKDGSRFWGEVRSRDVVYEGKPMRVASLRDVTERHSWEEKKELAIQQERQARIEAERAIQLRDDFLAIASHELKTPLTPLKLDLQIQRRFLSEADLPPSRKKDLLLRAINHADREYERLVSLIDDLLDTSRITAGGLPLKINEVDLSELVRNVTGRFAGDLHRAQCPLQLDVEDGIICACDGPRIEQVLSNLLQNAVKYGAGSRVAVRLSRLGDMAVISVTDHGIGIPQEHHATLFERFVRAVPVESYGGLGLGLFIAKEIVDGHGGNIFVESALGEGARFTVQLPLRPGKGNSVVTEAGKG